MTDKAILTALSRVLSRLRIRHAVAMTDAETIDDFLNNTPRQSMVLDEWDAGEIALRHLCYDQAEAIIKKSLTEAREQHGPLNLSENTPLNSALVRLEQNITVALIEAYTSERFR